MSDNTNKLLRESAQNMNTALNLNSGYGSYGSFRQPFGGSMFPSMRYYGGNYADRLNMQNMYNQYNQQNLLNNQQFSYDYNRKQRDLNNQNTIQDAHDNRWLEIYSASLAQSNGKQVADRIQIELNRGNAGEAAKIMDKYIEKLTTDIQAHNNKVRRDNPGVTDSVLLQQGLLVKSDPESVKATAFQDLGGETFLRTLEESNSSFKEGVLAPLRAITGEDTNLTGEDTNLTGIYNKLGREHDQIVCGRKKNFGRVVGALGASLTAAGTGAAIGWACTSWSGLGAGIGAGLGFLLGGVVGGVSYYIS